MDARRKQGGWQAALANGRAAAVFSGCCRCWLLLLLIDVLMRRCVDQSISQSINQPTNARIAGRCYCRCCCCCCCWRAVAVRAVLCYAMCDRYAMRSVSDEDGGRTFRDEGWRKGSACVRVSESGWKQGRQAAMLLLRMMILCCCLSDGRDAVMRCAGEVQRWRGCLRVC